MSKFEKLATTYKAKELYWGGVQSMVSRVRTDFHAYLGVPEDKLISFGSELLPVVSTGKVDEGGDFIAIPDDELLTNQSSIVFSLRLAYGSKKSVSRADPKSFIVFELSIKGTESGYPVTIQGSEVKEFNGPLYNVLFDELFRRAVASIR